MIIWFSIGFIGTIFGLYQFSALPSLVWLIPGLVIGLIAYFAQNNRIVQLVAGGIIGWIVLICWLFLTPNLSEFFINQTIWVEGRVDGLVEYKSRADNPRAIQRFKFRIQRVEHNGQHQAWWFAYPKVRLSCYDCDLDIQTNQVWRLKVKLKPIHGAMNPGGFDYEAWAHYQQLQASGYIRAVEDSKFLYQDVNLQTLRAGFAHRMSAVLSESSFNGIYSALLFADRQAISDEQWEVLRQTGTIHLMAISGLHMALVGLMGFLIGGLIWRLPIRRFEYYPVQWLGAALAAIFISVYGVLAGFTIPTQRAWIMALVVIGFLLWRRKVQIWPMLLLAALLVVAWHPSSVLSQGFWLSFLAVALIFSWLSQPISYRLRPWQNLLLIQGILSVGLMPVLWWFYQQVPVYSFVANLVAVPFVSFIGLPLLFVIALAQLLVPGLVPVLLSVSDLLWSGMWWFLTQVSNWPLESWVIAPRDLWQVMLVYGALFVALLVKPTYLRFLAVLLAFIVWFWTPSNLKLLPEQARVSLLDVGQGQALVVETANHVLVYDTGPSFGERFNGATIALSPYLRHQGWQKIDMLMVSHADRDHAGGTQTLLADWPISQKMSGQIERLGVEGFASCHNVKPWSWDGVVFQPLTVQAFNPKHHNDQSCILKVSVGESSLLISGDLSSRFEQALIESQPKEVLKSSILVAGHHGSRYSTSSAWLKAVEPDYVLFSAGYLNRFGFPHSDVVERVEKQGAKTFNTACDGAIQFILDVQGTKLENRHRLNEKRWFHQDCEES